MTSMTFREASRGRSPACRGRSPVARPRSPIGAGRSVFSVDINSEGFAYSMGDKHEPRVSPRTLPEQPTDPATSLFLNRSICLSMPAGDLASLKIHDSARTRGGAGKFLGYFAALIGLLLLIGGAVFALKNRAPVVEVTTARPAGDPARQTLLNASGYVTPRRRATVAAKITGRVTGVFFDEGNHAKEGQLLARLDDSDSQKALASAKADRESSAAQIADLQVQLRLAEIQLKRTQGLVDAKVSTQEALDNASAS